MEESKSNLQKLITVMEDKNLSVSQVIELIEKSNVQIKKVVDTANEITLIVDYTKTIDQAIDDGNYDWENYKITAKNFPVSPEMIGKKVEVTTKLFHFNYQISSKDAISEMGKNGYRPANLRELLALGFIFPELQRQFPIVALGSIFHRIFLPNCVPVLDVPISQRELYLCWFTGVWAPRFSFLGVRK